MHPGVYHFGRLLRYDAWASAETVRSLRAGEAPPKAVGWMGHLIGSGELWLARLRQEPPSLAVWPELTLDECAAGIDRLAGSWPLYLAALSPEDLAEGVGYRNSLGEYWTSSVTDILTHVTIHGAYHRAQIAAAIRDAGGTPPYTDFIHAARQGLIE